MLRQNVKLKRDVESAIDSQQSPSHVCVLLRAIIIIQQRKRQNFNLNLEPNNNNLMANQIFLELVEHWHIYCSLKFIFHFIPVTLSKTAFLERFLKPYTGLYHTAYA